MGSIVWKRTVLTKILIVYVILSQRKGHWIWPFDRAKSPLWSTKTNFFFLFFFKQLVLPAALKHLQKLSTVVWKLIKFCKTKPELQRILNLKSFQRRRLNHLSTILETVRKNDTLQTQQRQLPVPPTNPLIFTLAWLQMFEKRNEDFSLWILPLHDKNCPTPLGFTCTRSRYWTI